MMRVRDVRISSFHAEELLTYMLVRLYTNKTEVLKATFH